MLSLTACRGSAVERSGPGMVTGRGSNGTYPLAQRSTCGVRRLPFRLRDAVPLFVEPGLSGTHECAGLR